MWQRAKDQKIQITSSSGLSKEDVERMAQGSGGALGRGQGEA